MPVAIPALSSSAALGFQVFSGGVRITVVRKLSETPAQRSEITIIWSEALGPLYFEVWFSSTSRSALSE